jgi:hydrogenase maturation protease
LSQLPSTGDRLIEGETNVLVIGIGNAYRGDDAAGLRVATLLRERAADWLNIIEASGEGAALIEAWHGADRVILIDAARSGAQAGTIHYLNANAETLPRQLFNASTHAFGVIEAIEIARALKQLPLRVIVYAIEGRCFDMGAALSPEVERAARRVAERIIDEMATLPRQQADDVR